MHNILGEEEGVSIGGRRFVDGMVILADKTIGLQRMLKNINGIKEY